MLVTPESARAMVCPHREGHCQANVCMAWRWLSTPLGTPGAPQMVQNPKVPGEGVGFCGLACNPCEVKDS